MRNLFVFSLAAAIALLMTQPIFAAKICLQDNLGDFYVLKGGKPDKKSYTVKANYAASCTTPGHAEVTLLASGQYALGMYTAHDTADVCNTVRFYAVGDVFLNSSGFFDRNSDGNNDGAITFTAISCSSVPPFSSIKKEDRVPGGIQ